MNTHSFKAFPILTGERIILRQLTAADETAIFKLRSDDRVNEFLDRPKTLLVAEAGEFIQKINTGIENNGWLYWAIVLKDDESDLIGTICLLNFSADKTVAEIGYELMPEYQGKGIMQEAIKAVIDFCFDKLHLKAIEAYTHPQNKNSSRLLKKFHFIVKEEASDKNEPVTMIKYTLTR